MNWFMIHDTITTVLMWVMFFWILQLQKTVEKLGRTRD